MCSSLLREHLSVVQKDIDHVTISGQDGFINSETSAAFEIDPMRIPHVGPSVRRTPQCVFFSVERTPGRNLEGN